MHILCRLGITANYAGFHYTAYAVMLAVEDPGKLQLATKWLYPEVAKYYGTTPAAVERSIRRATNTVLTYSFPRFTVIIGQIPTVRPRTAQFLSLLAACVPPPPAA